MVVAVTVTGAELVIAKKLSPTNQPVRLSLTSTRCWVLRSMATGEPDVPVCTLDVVNMWFG